jgi:ferric-dicitrate binding protein FerR (iron transport regulator)
MSQERICNLVARRLTAEATTSEMLELEQLLKLHPEMQEVVAALYDNWQQIPNSDTDFLEATYLMHVAKMEKSGVWETEEPQQMVSDEIESVLPFYRTTTFIASLAVLILFISGLFIWNMPNAAIPTTVNEKLYSNEVSTRNGNRTKIQLPDGSTVWLNAGSKLNYHKSFGNENREVMLSGEAYFDVARDPQKPFIVHTESVDVKVLGTVFNLKSYPNDKTTEASLIHGSVQISVRKGSKQVYILKPNEKLTVMNQLNSTAFKAASLSSSSKLIPAPVALGNLTYKLGEKTAIETAWVENKLSFVDKSFADLALELERWYNIQIVFQNTQSAAMHFTGSFTYESIEEALAALQFSSHFNYKIIKDKIIIE